MHREGRGAGDAGARGAACGRGGVDAGRRRAGGGRRAASLLFAAAVRRARRLLPRLRGLQEPAPLLRRGQDTACSY